MLDFLKVLIELSLTLYGVNILEPAIWEQCNNTRGAVVLSFDDAYIDSWLDAQDILDGQLVKATFFISYFAELQQDEKISKLEKLAEAGHEIGHHTWSHPSLRDTIKQIHTDGTNVEQRIQELLHNEIVHASQLLKALQLDVTSFAYPYGQRSDKSDSLLEKHFHRLRDYRAFRTKGFNVLYSIEELYTGNGLPALVNSAGIDNTGHSHSEIIGLLDEASHTKAFLFLTAHKIVGEGNREAYAVQRSTLEMLIEEAQKRNLIFITFQDIEDEEQKIAAAAELGINAAALRSFRSLAAKDFVNLEIQPIP